MRPRSGARRRGWVPGLALGLLAAAGLRAGTVPFMEPFDTLPSGVLHAQNSWESQRQRDVQVQTTVAFDGAKAAVVATNAVLWNSFNDPAVTNVWIDFYARQRYPSNDAPPSITGSVAAAFYVDSSGALRVTSNNTWLTLSQTVPSNVWRRYTVNLDYVTHRWSLFLADEVPNRLSTTVITNVPFWSSSTNAYFQRFRVKN
ncbi:MAG: hypothetical protein K8T26_04045 [Lentisphaerae bacterium]|nr:hypothetical protein [Lentisphaerota bacterium]